MSPPEIAFRVVEQARRFVDRRRIRDWAMFGGFAGPVAGLHGLAKTLDPSPELKALARGAADAVLSGRFTLLGRRWPSAPTVPWWEDDLWRIDPVSVTLWPGAETFPFDVAYREHHGRGDVKFVWELNRLQMLPPLALHAGVTGDTSAGDRVYDILRGWMDAHPPYRGVNWISGIEAASRVVSVLAAVALRPPPTPEDMLAVKAFLHAHVRWIARYPSRFSSANNHRVAELTALLLATAAAPGLPHAKRLGSRARDGLEQEILRQVHPDGVGAEQSTFYAAYALEWFVLAGIAADAEGAPFSSAYKDRVGAAADYLCAMLDAGGHAPRIGDGDDGRVLASVTAVEPRYAASVAALAARWLARPEAAADLRDPALRDLIGDPTPPSAPPAGLRTFPQGGMSVWRRAGLDGDVLLAFDHGPLGHLSIAAHGHADALAVWLHWGEETVFADPGTHLYHAGGESRELLRATRAHNTLCIEDQDQSRIIGPFAWAAHARSRWVQASEEAVDAEHDGYRKRFGLIHRRRVEMNDDAVVIEDRLLGRAKKTRLSWSIGFTLAPGVDAATNDHGVEIVTPGGRSLSMTSAAEAGGPLRWTLKTVPYAAGFGVLSSTTRLEIAGVLSDAPLIVRTCIEFK